jgi:hypothetical protein
MRDFRKWGRHKSDLEAELRMARPRTRAEFRSDLAEHILASRPTPTVRPWSRVAFAGAVAALMLGTFASFGGIGYAASGAGNTYKTVKTLVIKQRVTVHHSAASAQYQPPPPKIKDTGSAAGNEAASGGVEAAAAAGTLPFTGFSLLATVLVSLGLIATGVVLRRRERSDS